MKREAVTCKFEHKQRRPMAYTHTNTNTQTGGLWYYLYVFVTHTIAFPIDDVGVVDIVHKSNYSGHLPYSDTVYPQSTHDNDDQEDCERVGLLCQPMENTICYPCTALCLHSVAEYWIDHPPKWADCFIVLADDACVTCGSVFARMCCVCLCMFWQCARAMNKIIPLC